jgi:hypothetical protein
MTTTELFLTGDAAVAEGGALTVQRRSGNPQHLARVAEAAKLTKRVFEGDRRAMLQVQELMTTSDFPKLFGDVLDRALLAQYEQISPIWSGVATRVQVNDFRAKHWIDLLGGRAELDPVGQGGEYPARALTEGDYNLTVGKFGARLPLTWEMIINDDLGAFQTAPARLAQAAVDTEDKLNTRLYATATGPNTAFFTGATAPDNKALTVDNLSAALTTVATRRDSDNRPIMIRAFVLVVPPALEVMAHNIVNATLIRLRNDASSASGARDIEVTNWLAGKVTIVTNPWLPVIDLSGSGANAAKTWYLFPAPSTPRPALVMGFLRGHETPDLRVKADGGQRVGGGSVPAEEGSFDNDDIQYRIRHVTGGTTLDPIATYASVGP